MSHPTNFGGNNQNNINSSVGYPKFSEVQNTPNANLPNAPGPAPYNQMPPQMYEKPGEKPTQPIQQPQMAQPPQPKPQNAQPVPGQMYMGPHGPQYAAYPVAGPQFVPVAAPYPMGYYPPPMYPQPYPYYGQPPMVPTVLVLPPGYKRDNSCRYSPWGNLAEDLESLF